MGQFEFATWLLDWLEKTSGYSFEWDDGNSSKSLSKHLVPSEEVESVFALRQAVPLGVQVSPAVPEERCCVVGLSSSGRLISVVFTLRKGRVRPISARPASRKERRLYEAIRKAVEGI